MIHTTGVLETVLYAADLHAAEHFYTQVIKLELIRKEEGRHCFFRCGAGVFLVFNPAHTSTVPTTVEGQSIPLHGTRGPGHMAFAVRESDLPDWRAWLDQNNVRIESQVTWPQGGVSLYLRDPAGNVVELATPRLWGL
jgi:catechol 2,3-dioxygenase-like lactoylglutathione lyase family enzyme